MCGFLLKALNAQEGTSKERRKRFRAPKVNGWILDLTSEVYWVFEALWG